MVPFVSKERYFMANFVDKVKTAIHSYLGLKAAVASATGEYSQGKWK